MTVSKLLDVANTPDGKRLSLTREGSDLTLYVEASVLMSSRLHGSEETLALVGCDRLGKVEGARVLVGGLGLGYTLRATLDLVRPDAVVEVVELIPAVVRWHREGPLGELAKRPVDDPRTQVVVMDLGAHLRRARASAYDAMLLDVDNGPRAMASTANAWLYDAGLTVIREKLRPGGRVVFWSAFEDREFERRLARSGFDEVRVVRCGAAHRGDKDKHVLFVASVRAPGGR